jgi:septal ring factor EnvC (AmiA/AmiB activator)
MVGSKKRIAELEKQLAESQEREHKSWFDNQQLVNKCSDLEKRIAELENELIGYQNATKTVEPFVLNFADVVSVERDAEGTSDEETLVILRNKEEYSYYECSKEQHRKLCTAFRNWLERNVVC